MPPVKKNKSPRSYVNNTKSKTVIITKSKSGDNTSFPKKVKSMNTLLAKETLLSS
jgi:hypothetical protein